MNFKQSPLLGAFMVELEPHVDERGFFARSFCEMEFERMGLPTHFPQSNLSRNVTKGTLRGMHYDALPSKESKVVRCVSGSIYDVIIDLRRESTTRWQWFGIELTGETGAALFIPPGFAHGFITLADRTDVLYQMGDVYRPASSRGLRYNDRFFGIRWPIDPKIISGRDRDYLDFDPTGFDDQQK